MKKLSIFLLLTVVLTACGPIDSNAPENMPEELKQSYLDVIDEREAELAEGKTSISIHEDIAFAYHQLREYDEAIEHYETVLEGDVHHYVALNNLMDLYKEMDDYENAVVYAMRLYEANPDTITVLKKVINLFLAADEKELALQALENFARNNGSDPEYIQLISDLYEKIEE